MDDDRLHDKGYRVVGVEYVDSAAREFFAEVDLPFEEALCDVLQCKIYQVNIIQRLITIVYGTRRPTSASHNVLCNPGKGETSRVISVQ